MRRRRSYSFGEERSHGLEAIAREPRKAVLGVRWGSPEEDRRARPREGRSRSTGGRDKPLHEKKESAQRKDGGLLLVRGGERRIQSSTIRSESEVSGLCEMKYYISKFI